MERRGESISVATAGKVETPPRYLTVSGDVVISGIYQEAPLAERSEKGAIFLAWLKGKCKIASLAEQISVQSGGLKKMVKVSIPGCCTMATADAHGGDPSSGGQRRRWRHLKAA